MVIVVFWNHYLNSFCSYQKEIFQSDSQSHSDKEIFLEIDLRGNKSATTL